MTETTKCSCGSNEPKRIIFLAGQANVGQLTNLAAIQLTEEGYGSIACASLLAIGAENLIANAMNADEVVILDGCPMLCAKKMPGTGRCRRTAHGPDRTRYHQGALEILHERRHRESRCGVLERRRPGEVNHKAEKTGGKTGAAAGAAGPADKIQGHRT